MELARLLESGAESSNSVLEHRPRRCWTGRREKGEDKDVRVPEDVPAIAITTQPARSERRLSVRPDDAHEVEQRETHVALQLGITADADVGVSPAPGPPLAVRAVEGIDTLRSRGLRSLPRHSRLPACVDRDAVEDSWMIADLVSILIDMDGQPTALVGADLGFPHSGFASTKQLRCTCGPQHRRSWLGQRAERHRG